MARDDFSKDTITKLAERVGFLCSNPACRTHTVGPNSEQTKSTRIGKGAHITAAAVGGPRYETGLTPEQRSHISNGIWLCANCADLIDKDEGKFPTILLNSWKADAELEMHKRLKGEPLESVAVGEPYLEVDLVWQRGGRSPRGYSNKNPVEVDENGRWVTFIGAGVKPIIHWELNWSYALKIYNNSSYPAYNICFRQISDLKFTTLEKLPIKNNLPPYDYLELKAKYVDRVEGIHTVADEIMAKKIPDALNGLTFEIVYFDEGRQEHRTGLKIVDGTIENNKII
ncbi:hypothetical protein JN11_03402 [Mucilaginibacter frigoritolerans]|uniref:HNH endonuclease n=1 Tax=Mucilaginibacter frigoritolerans TaxID=652788 RepID=A0A562TXL9_9SPHI|nr:hypothetical protein [Mucilaginibacter frigoritolerans]TWI97580.1 hypothetical protein JN11_03402 [Mucilaginibacter frigoritolerans]